MLSFKSLLAVAAMVSLSAALPDKRQGGPIIPESCVVTTTVANTAAHSCPLETACPPVPECIILKTTTVSVPCRTNCPSTPTVTVTGPITCPTCQTGCATDLVTTTKTAAC